MNKRMIKWCHRQERKKRCHVLFASLVSKQYKWKASTKKKLIKKNNSYVSTWDKQWPTGCVWTTWGPCSDQPVDRNLWDTPLRCCLAKQTPLPSPPLTQSAETLTGGPARNLYWQAATTNQSTEGMPGSRMRTLRKMWVAVTAFLKFYLIFFYPFPILRIGLSGSVWA